MHCRCLDGCHAGKTFMKNLDVTIVRVYITEASKLLEKLLDYLNNEAKVRGVTVFRGIGGFGDSKAVHSATFIDLALSLPLVVEFFDDASKVKPIVEHLNAVIKPEHVVFWNAKTNVR